MLSLSGSKPLKLRGWKKALGAALLLIACEPFIPGGNCEDIPSCSAMDYRISLEGSDIVEIDSLTGAYQINAHQFWIFIREWEHPEQAACRSTGRSGVAHAFSCAPCSGPHLIVDSLYFTTDILLLRGDTLKAGYNFATNTSIQGIKGGVRSLLIDKAAPIRFRDSLFEVRFTGTIDSVQKTAVSAVRITNPAMLFP